MKKTLILLTALLLWGFASTNAQVTDQGNFIFGSSIGFSSAESNTERDINGQVTETRGSTSSQFNIAPSIGVFLANEFAVGIGFNYTFNSVDEPNDDRDTDSDFLFGPFARYYVLLGGDKAFFLEANLGFGSSRNEVDIAGQEETLSNNVFAVGIGPGFTIFSDDAVGIEAIFKYNYARSNTELTSMNDNYDITTITNQFDISVGFQVYFSRLIRPGR